MNPTQLAKETGVPQPTIQRILSGESADPRSRTLQPIADYFDITVEYLRTGPIEYLSGQPADENTPTSVEWGPRFKGTVPLISWVQAGDWQDITDNLQPGDGERIETVYKSRDHTYALRVRGDSMEPKFPDGAIIIVEPEEQAQSGSYVIVRQNGGDATFKQLQIDGSDYFLKPLNSRYPIMQMNPDAVICGVVKCMQMDV